MTTLCPRLYSDSVLHDIGRVDGHRTRSISKSPRVLSTGLSIFEVCSSLSILSNVVCCGVDDDSGFCYVCAAEWIEYCASESY